MAIRQGKTTASSTAQGFYLGNDSGSTTAQFHIGDANSFLRWNGSTLSVTAVVTAQAGSSVALLEVSYPNIARLFLAAFSSSTCTVTSSDYGNPTITNGSGSYNYSWSKLADIQQSNGGGTISVSPSNAQKPNFTVTGMSNSDEAFSLFRVTVTDTQNSATASALVSVSIIREP